MKTRVHAFAGGIGFLTILTFWTSTVVSELFASHETVAAIKQMILYGMFILIPAMAIAGGSGMSMGKSRTDVPAMAKKKRMPRIAANGLLILLPSAFYLASKSAAGAFDAWFYAVQALELVAGAANLTMMGLNIRDGLKMTGRIGPSYTVELVGREMVADGTAAWRFSKPAGFKHVAGQYLKMTLLNPSKRDAKGPSRVLTIASAPHEPELTVMTRLRDSAFKQELNILPVGGQVRIVGPNGQMTLHEDPARPAVFIAGGIGITPFLAIASDAAHAGLRHKITLFYSNHQPSDAARLNVLQSYERTNPNFRLVATMTKPQDKTWTGETGPIDQEMLSRHLSDLTAPIYYVAGSTAMVEAMRDMLTKIGIAKHDIRSDEFYGY